MMIDDAHSVQEWITLDNASKITGKSTGALRLAIQRHKIVRTKKIKDNGREYWVIHRDELQRMCAHVRNELCAAQDDRTMSDQPCAIPFDLYDRHRREWEDKCAHLEQGLMMYRYKFEELDKQIKMLPAPPEAVSKELEFKTTALAQAQLILQQAQETQRQYEESMAQLKLKLQEEEYAKEAFKIQWELTQADLKRPWWKKLFGIK